MGTWGETFDEYANKILGETFSEYANQIKDILEEKECKAWQTKFDEAWQLAIDTAKEIKKQEKTSKLNEEKREEEREKIIKSKLKKLKEVDPHGPIDENKFKELVELVQEETILGMGHKPLKQMGILAKKAISILPKVFGMTIVTAGMAVAATASAYSMVMKIPLSIVESIALEIDRRRWNNKEAEYTENTQYKMGAKFKHHKTTSKDGITDEIDIKLNSGNKLKQLETTNSPYNTDNPISAIVMSPAYLAYAVAGILQSTGYDLNKSTSKQAFERSEFYKEENVPFSMQVDKFVEDVYKLDENEKKKVFSSVYKTLSLKETFNDNKIEKGTNEIEERIKEIVKGINEYARNNGYINSEKMSMFLKAASKEYDRQVNIKNMFQGSFDNTFTDKQDTDMKESKLDPDKNPLNRQENKYYTQKMIKEVTTSMAKHIKENIPSIVSGNKKPSSPSRGI